MFFVIGAVDDRPARAFTECGEDLHDFLDIVIEVEMLLLDIEDEAGLRRKERQRAVTFIGFDYEGRAIRPQGVCAQQRDLRADIVRRILVGLAQDVGEHRRGRRLAMAARDDVGLLGLGQHGEAFRTAHAEDRVLVGRAALRIFRRDGRGENDQLRAVDVRGLVAFEITDAFRHIIRRQFAGNEIGPADRMTLRKKQAREAAHAAAADADEVDRLRGRVEDLLEACCQIGLHDASISSATRFAALVPASRRAAMLMRLRTSSFSKTSVTASCRLSGVALLSTRMRAAPES